MPQYKENIRKIFRQSSKAEITSGVYWYEEARKTAIAIGQEFDIDVDTVCLVISALSPNNNWSRNISDAWKVCRVWSIAKYASSDMRKRLEDSCRTCTYPANRQKAFDILDGKLDYLRGLKTQNFARNLQGCEESITVDVHAYSIANGKRFTTKTVKPISKRVYEEISLAYTVVAFELDIRPSQLQAVVWQTWRRLNGLTSARELTPRLFEN